MQGVPSLLSSQFDQETEGTCTNMGIGTQQVERTGAGEGSIWRRVGTRKGLGDSLTCLPKLVC